MIENFRRMAVFLLPFVICLQTAAKEWTVCMQCPAPTKLTTIEEALRQSKPGDAITVIYEPGFPVLMENIVINKPVKLTSRHPDRSIDDFDAHPILSSTFSGSKAIIRVTSPGVEISGFNFDNMGALTDPEIPENSFGKETGIILEAPAKISYCKFNHLQAAIVSWYQTPPGASGSVIEHCQIGEPTTMTWEKNSRKHPGNFYGIILLPPLSSSDSSASYFDAISSCKIVGNRYYGVVYSLINQPKMFDTVVELNGMRPFRLCKIALDQNGGLQWVE